MDAAQTGGSAGSLPDQNSAFDQPGGSGGGLPDQDMAFAQQGCSGGSQPHQDDVGVLPSETPK